MGSTDNHYQKEALFRVFKVTPGVWPKISSKKPITIVIVAFVDISSNGKVANILYTNSTHSTKWTVLSPGCTAQQSKLDMFHELLWDIAQL